jgi:hypothetical protein
MMHGRIVTEMPAFTGSRIRGDDAEERTRIRIRTFIQKSQPPSWYASRRRGISKGIA